MGRIARVISFLRGERNGAKVSDVKTDAGGGANVTAEHFQPAGDDAFPLDSDYVIINPVAGTGREVVTGYLDPLNAPKANAGDKRIYARDASDGSVVVEVWLKNDGTAIVSNSNGSFTLSPDGSIKGLNGAGVFELEVGGDFVANGAKMTTSGDVVTASGVSLDNHPHAQPNDSGGNTEQPTSAPTPTE